MPYNYTIFFCFELFLDASTMAGLLDFWSKMCQIRFFGSLKYFWMKIIPDHVYFHMIYHNLIWNYVGWHRRVLIMTHFQLFAWFGQTLLFLKTKYLKNHNFQTGMFQAGDFEVYLCLLVLTNYRIDWLFWSQICFKKPKVPRH